MGNTRRHGEISAAGLRSGRRSEGERSLGTEPQTRTCYFSASAQEHAEDRHPIEFAACIANIDRILQFPEWVERSPHQRDGFALIRRVNLGKDILLVALKIKLDEDGRYIVSSTYKVTTNDIENRVRKGYAKPV
jgi:hypothetical protein